MMEYKMQMKTKYLTFLHSFNEGETNGFIC